MVQFSNIIFACRILELNQMKRALRGRNTLSGETFVKTDWCPFWIGVYSKRKLLSSLGEQKGIMTYSLEAPRWTILICAQNKYFHDKIRYPQIFVFLSYEKNFLGTQLITKTYLYNVNPLKPHFYIVKLGNSGVYIIFLISAQKHRLCQKHNLCFEQKFEKYQNFYMKIFIFCW